MKKLFFLACLTLLSGCFWIMRVPLPREQKCDHCHSVTNTIWESIPNYPMCIYPTVHLRYHLFAFSWSDAPEGYEWRKVGGPCAGIVSLIGLPLDFVVDTVALPWDWNANETASCPMCNERGCWNDAVPEDAPLQDDGVMIRINGTRVR